MQGGIRTNFGNGLWSHHESYLYFRKSTTNTYFRTSTSRSAAQSHHIYYITPNSHMRGFVPHIQRGAWSNAYCFSV